MQVKNTKNVVFAGLIVLLLGVLWYRVVYSSMESKAAKDKSAAHDANQSADQLRGAISGSSGTKKTKNQDIAPSVMLAAIPADSAEATFLRSIDELRVSSGADWQSITPTAAATVGNVGSINVGILVTGNETELAAYANGLFDLKRIFVIDNFSISGTSSGTTGTPGPGGTFVSGGLQLQVAGRIFTQPGAVASATTPTGTATTPATVAPVTGATVAPSGVQNN